MSLVLRESRLEEALATVAPPPPGLAARLAAWTELLDRWQRVQRLVGWRRGEDLLREGLLDAWAAACLLASAPPGPLLDLGSGAGLPGLILAAAQPDRPVHLVEARRKRAAFLTTAARALELRCVQVHHAREEDLLLLASRPRPALLSARAYAAPAEILAAAERWSAPACLLGSSRARLPQPPAPWPPPGWTLHVERPGHPPRATHFHALMFRSPPGVPRGTPRPPAPPTSTP